MNISLKTWLYVAGIAIVLLAIGIGGKLWLEDHDGHIRAVYELKDLHAQIDKLKAEREQIQTDTATKVEEVHAARAAAKTPQQTADYIRQEIPVHFEWRQPLDAQGKEIAGAPAEAVVPEKELPKLADYAAEAKSCTVKLDGCLKEKLNLEAQGRNQDSQISVIDSEKNGTKKSKLKWAALGALAGGIAVTILKKH
jgi:predicted  nucleic acid-binding Zn-ribbon protein